MLPSVVVRCRRVQPLAGQLVVDLTRFLPGPFATRELLRLGARVVRVVRPSREDVAALAAGWDDALVAGKETIVCDLKADPAPVHSLLGEADVVVESFRPGVATRLGVGPERAGERTIYCSITGFGLDGPHAGRAGHDLNYLGWAGALAETGPGMPPLPFADFAGAYRAIASILAALLERERTGLGTRLTVSMAHEAHELARARPPGILTGLLACYRTYATADGRYLTVGALERPFFSRLCELLGQPDLAERQYDPNAQELLAEALGAAFASRTLASWLEQFDGEDVAVGPVDTLDEAAAELRS
jgi:alpha-methylacyl-CoA racemase